MSSLVNQKHQIDSGNGMPVALVHHMNSLTMASNNRDMENYLQVSLKEEDSVHQLADPMEIEEQCAPDSTEKQEEVGSAFIGQH
jgi:hypothetical protein